MPNDQKDIRQEENELFARMAKVHQPLAPDSAPTPPEQTSSPPTENLPHSHADAQRARLKARFPSLTDEELDSEMF